MASNNATNDDFLFKLESANVDEFAHLINSSDDAVLRQYFGEDLDALRSLAQPQRGASDTSKLGNVVVLHGILGAHLAENDSTIWLNPWSLLEGKFDRLVPGAARIEPQGLLKRYYGRQLLTLAQQWNVQAFAYDWRLSLNEGGNALAASIDKRFPTDQDKDAPVHLVAHSMGGLVARAFLQLRPTHKGRLVMLGTPNRGSYSIPQLLHGMHSLLTPLALIDLLHSRDEILQIIRSWPGVHEMDPANPHLAALPIDPSRMFYIAGNNRRTAVAIRDASRLGEPEGYEWGGAGDGTVPHCLGLLGGVPTYYVDDEHGSLPNNADVLAAVSELLEKGVTTKLATMPNVVRGEAPVPSDELAGFLTAANKNGQTKPTLVPVPPRVQCSNLADARNVDAVIVAHYEGVPPHLIDSRPALRALASQLPSGLGEPFYIPSTDGTPPILVMGLGPVGRLRETELRILVERIVWAATQFGIKSIATTLIGSGARNLPVERAAAIWREVLEQSQLQVTFIERDPERVSNLTRCLECSATSPASAASEAEPVARLSMERTRTGFRVALLTQDASIPEREIALDHALVDEMNERLADRRENAEDWAECLRHLLLPEELRQATATSGPVVVACDRATAQIPWEYLHPHISRQFRSQKASFRRTHQTARRILVVADTCADAPLPGAAAEGTALVALFRERGLDVTALIGPQQATRVAVLRELMLRRYDVMHYAGHCAYEPDDATHSGWVFTGATMLSGRELERLDAVPALIFSNACESGKLADVPGFAEALFGLGVQNLVATARPVGDAAAKAFAMAFYGAAGGPFHVAMRAGRLAAKAESASWQHYGDPAQVLLGDPAQVLAGDGAQPS